MQGTFCRNRQGACERFQAEAKRTSNGVENPRTAADSEKLVQWYVDKLRDLEPLHKVYIDGDSQAASSFIDQSRALWISVAQTIATLEKNIAMPFCLEELHS